MTKKTDPFYDEDLNFVCPITSKDVLDDCHISIEFGYGSDKDMTTYTFSPVHDEVGKKVLKFIDDLIQKEYNNHPRLGVKIGTKPSVEDFSRCVMDDLFDKDLPKWNDQDKKKHGLE